MTVGRPRAVTEPLPPPAPGASPEWVSEKAVTIAAYVAASGIPTVLSENFAVMRSEFMREYLTEGMEEVFGARFELEQHLVEAAHWMLQMIENRREGLGLQEVMYESVRSSDLEEIYAGE